MNHIIRGGYWVGNMVNKILHLSDFSFFYRLLKEFSQTVPDHRIHG